MSELKLFLAWEFEEDEGDFHIVYERTARYYKKTKEVTVDDVTSQQLVEFLDSDLENDNYHAIVGVNAALLRILSKRLDEQGCKEVFWEIAQRGGFTELKY